MSEKYARAEGAVRRPAPSEEETEKMVADAFNGGGQCEALCQELETASEALDGATGKVRHGLLVRMAAINRMRKSLNCRECFFQ